MDQPFWLELVDVVRIHVDQINRYGGLAGVRDFGLLQSAVAMPRASFEGERLHRDIFEMAAAYAYHIAQNHPFVNGNKRTALASALVFLDLNGVSIEDPKSRFYDVMIEVSTGAMGKQRLADVLRNSAAR